MHNNSYPGVLKNINENVKYILLHQCNYVKIPYLSNLKVLFYTGSMSNERALFTEDYHKLKDEDIDWHNQPGLTLYYYEDNNKLYGFD